MNKSLSNFVKIWIPIFLFVATGISIYYNFASRLNVVEAQSESIGPKVEQLLIDMSASKTTIQSQTNQLNRIEKKVDDILWYIKN